MSWVCRRGAPRASLSVRTLDSGTCFHREAKGRDQSQGPLCGPVLRGGGTHPAKFWVLGPDPHPLLVPNEKVTWDARSVLAAGAELSVPQPNAQLLPRGASREASHCRSPSPRPSQRPAPEPGCLPAGTLSRAPAKHSPRAGLRASGTLGLVSPKFLSPSLEAGLVPVGKTANKQPTKQSRKVKATANFDDGSFFPRIVSDPPGRDRKEVTNTYCYHFPPL